MKRLWVLLIVVLYGAETGTEERLWRYRNLGKAFYENPTTQAQAVDEFRKALELAPGSARERLNYGLALLRAGKTKEGLAELEQVQKQDPKLPHTYFNLGIVYRKNGDFDKAIPEFQKMTQLVPDEPVSHYNLGVLYKQTGNSAGARKELETAEKLNASLAAPHFQLYNLYRQEGRKEDAARELTAFQQLKKEQEGAVIPEDMEWSDYAEIYDPIDPKDAAGTPPPVPHGPRQAPAGALRGLSGVISFAEGDYDNDGRADLCVLTASGPVLLHNVNGRFERVDAHLPAGRFDKAVWLDYDHDYDLDLLLLGAHSVLLRNQGAAGFRDHTKDFPFAAGHAIDAAPFRLMADSKAFDLMVSYADHPGVLYRDRLGGNYEPVHVPQLPTGAKWLEASDVNRDSWLDVVSSTGTLLNRHGTFEAAPQPVSDGTVELDKRPAAGQWIAVQLTGVKNLKLAYGAEVEVKSGALYQKKIYNGKPLMFALGKRTIADTVRITWPNGLIQNEPNQAADHVYTYKEAQRLSGSCPMIWTWDGHGFRFITDVLGVAPLGASSGDGQYFPVDHDEYIQIPGDALAAVDGRLDVRITEELSEVSYLDQVRLFAVDHPAAMSIVTSERWKGPPFPDFRLYGVNARVYPKLARDGQGRDVLERITKHDGHYADTFRHDLAGVAELHTLDLDFGRQAAPRNKGVLVLNGWVDWADGSTFLAMSQEGKGGLIPPYLQVRDAAGRWKTVIEDMGMPDGKPKTIAVDLSGKFLSASREVRIVTNLCVFWDEIYMGEDPAPPRVNRQELRAASAEVRFRGFSGSRIYPRRDHPEEFFYGGAMPASLWNPTPGMYTRYGDVLDLAASADDRFVIMGSGDELRLQFRADALPRLPAGWTRDYILKVDGWAKDRDANTAFSQSVEPLPFHAMSRYPYPSSEHYPDDEMHRRYQREYNTRPALRLIRPLISAK